MSRLSSAPAASAGPAPRPPRRRPHGFTLVELMLTLVVAVVLIAIAVPSFRSVSLSNKLMSTSNDIVASIQTARMEAIKRNATVQVCSDLAANNGSGTGCGTQAGAVYAGTALVRVGPTIPASIKVSGGMMALRFSGQGIGHKVSDTAPVTGTVVDICTSAMSKKNHRVIKIAAGSVITTTITDGTCL